MVVAGQLGAQIVARQAAAREDGRRPPLFTGILCATLVLFNINFGPLLVDPVTSDYPNRSRGPMVAQEATAAVALKRQSLLGGLKRGSLLRAFTRASFTTVDGDDDADIAGNCSANE